MIMLRATSELKYTFERLIAAMKAPVQWTGVFLVVDNYLILQGELRSLFFHFDSRKVATNLFDYEIKEEEVQEIGGNTHVINVINMILYVFGKWGTLPGIKVEKNYEQLNQLFGNIMKEIGVEPEYNYQYMRFYKDGIRVTYEDVVSFAREWEEKTPQESEEAEEEAGLWHKLLWKRMQCDFPANDTTEEDRRKERLGNNFYMVGYDCPVCRSGLHMVVYPVGKEFRIETEEGAVLLARAFTCNYCCRFYTPRPRKLLLEGDVYCMDFEGDRKAYEDYLALLGKRGERVSNPRYNEFADPSRREKEEEEEGGRRRKLWDYGDEDVDSIMACLPDYGEEDLLRLKEQAEAGFFPEDRRTELEEAVQERLAELRNGNGIDGNPGTSGFGGKEKAKGTLPGGHVRENHSTDSGRSERTAGAGAGVRNAFAGAGDEVRKGSSGAGDEVRKGASGASDGVRSASAGERGNDACIGPSDASASAAEAALCEEAEQKYETRMKLLGRLSPAQMAELKNRLEREMHLMPQKKREYLERVDSAIAKEKTDRLASRVESCAGKPYTVLKRVCEEVEQADVPMEFKEPLLQRLKNAMGTQGELEVKKLMEKLPPHMDRARYRTFSEKLKSYEGVDLSPYEEQLENCRREAERQEIANVVNRARKTDREDYAALEEKLREGDFLPELVNPYLEKIADKIRQMDEAAIDEIAGDVMHKDFDEAAEAYERIREGNFLPELKVNALEMLEKRLSKIKTDECELLVKKLQEDLTEAGVQANERHHFYPARRVLLKQAEPGETEVIEYALASYAAGRGLFEYPILVADSSRGQSGKEGFILTPEHFYYSNMMTSYGFPVSSIAQVKASTGLLNRGLYMCRKNGDKLKVPYVVENKELTAFAETLDAFIRYLQEKPQSRQVTYLAKEKHEKICCFRCGYLYQGGDVCPKCGYKNNV